MILLKYIVEDPTNLIEPSSTILSPLAPSQSGLNYILKVKYKALANR